MKVMDIVASSLAEDLGKNSELTDTTTFEELDMDSFEVVDFALSLETKFNIVFDNEELHDLHTIGDLVELVAAHLQEEKSC